jgi:hypothetical protein
MIGLYLLLGQADAWEYFRGIEAQFPSFPDCVAEETFRITLASGEETMSVFFAHGAPVWTSVRRARATAAMEIFSSATALPTSTWTWGVGGDPATFIHDPHWTTDLDDSVRASYEKPVQIVWLAPTEYNAISGAPGGHSNTRAAAWSQVHNDDPCDSTRWMFAIGINTAYDWQMPLPVHLP